MRLLQRHGPSSIKLLESELGVSTNAVREQLAQLQAADLVQVTKQPQPAGRPLNLYTLTARAQALLPHGYDRLLNLLFEEIVAEDGAAKLQQLLHGVAERLAAELGAATTAAPATQRVAEVQAALTQHNVAMTAVAEADGLRLHTWSCPYLALAAEHSGVCEMEAHMLERLLGQPIHVEQRIVDGHASCRFLVDERVQAPTAIQNEE